MQGGVRKEKSVLYFMTVIYVPTTMFHSNLAVLLRTVLFWVITQ
jgi:hypothetical protein